MSVKVNVYYFLPHLYNDRDEIEVSGNTVGECLEHLANLFPKARRWMFGEDGRVSNFVDIYVDFEMINPDDMDTVVGDGDVIHMVMMLTGG
ncbi:MoaD/ThiS family protein [Chloroflexota bacterium]